MALEHLQAGQVANVQPYGAALAGASNTALFKSAELEVMRLVLPKGKTMPAHQVQGEITIQCIEGVVQIDASASASASAPEASGSRRSSATLQAGQLLYLPGGAPHALLALEDASVLVTIVVK
jgi:quercetin dioxygenase-like cupin family protein